MIAVEYTSKEAKNIEITMPWNYWVKYHEAKGTLPYSIGKQADRNDTDDFILEL